MLLYSFCELGKKLVIKKITLTVTFSIDTVCNEVISPGEMIALTS